MSPIESLPRPISGVLGGSGRSSPSQLSDCDLLHDNECKRSVAVIVLQQRKELAGLH
jgi:hypothetical protein